MSRFGRFSGWPLLFMLYSSPPGMATESDEHDTDIGLDCEAIDVDFDDEPNLTRHERLQRMDEAFYDALNRFDQCLATQSQQDATEETAAQEEEQAAQVAQTTAVDGGATDLPDASESSEEPQYDSAASGELAGTEPVQTAPAESPPSLSQMETDALARLSSRALGAGAAPEDIPPADNDDTVAQQIRLAAEFEQNPEKKARLWNEYRKYKGLPQQ